MASNFKQDGDIIQYTATADTPSGGVVRIGNLLGVALVHIPVGATGSVALDGVFELPKVPGAVIAQGETLTWDKSAGAFDDNAATPAAGDVTGAATVAFAGAGAGTTTVLVKLTGTPGTVT